MSGRVQGSMGQESWPLVRAATAQLRAHSWGQGESRGRCREADHQMGLVWVSQQVQWKARPKESDSQDQIWAGVRGKPQYGGGEEANSGLGDWETDEGQETGGGWRPKSEPWREQRSWRGRARGLAVRIPGGGWYLQLGFWCW